jgi:hypothetical protein
MLVPLYIKNKLLRLNNLNFYNLDLEFGIFLMNFRMIINYFLEFLFMIQNSICHLKTQFKLISIIPLIIAVLQQIYNLKIKIWP